MSYKKKFLKFCNFYFTFYHNSYLSCESFLCHSTVCNRNIIIKFITFQTGAFIYFYKSDEDEEEDRIYNTTLHVHTPLESFPLLDIHGFLSLEESIYSANFTMVTNQSDIAFVGHLEVNCKLSILS